MKQPKHVVVRFPGVESIKRIQNAADRQIGESVVRHTFDIKAVDVPAQELCELDGPNPRTPNLRKKQAKSLKASLTGGDLSTVGAFHLAHAGIRAIVTSFKPVNSAKTEWEATFTVGVEDDKPDDGVANGLHTLKLIAEAQANDEAIPEDQYVTFTLLQGVNRDLIPYIGEGLNTSIQVQPESILNLAEAFEPFKEALSDEPYADLIGWQENANLKYDARDVFSVINALNVARYPVGGTTHPIESYEKQSRCIEAYEKEWRENDENPSATSFGAMIPMISDALELYHVIRHDSYDIYRSEPGTRAGALSIMESRKDRNNRAKDDSFSFDFMPLNSGLTVTGTYCLANGVAYAMLAAMRNYVEYDEDAGVMRWTTSFEEVKDAWRSLAVEMIRAAQETSQSLNYNPNAVGKNRPLWSQLNQMVENQQLRAQLQATR